MQYKVGECRLKQLLDQANMTQVELAEIIGKSSKWVGDIANKRGPRGMTLENAKSIAAALGVTIDDLYEWIPVKK